MHSRSLIALRLILIALIPSIQFASAHASSAAPMQAAAAQASGTWRLDKVTVKDSGLANQPTWTISHSDGSLSSSIPYVTHTGMGDTTGTWDGTNTWDSPPLLLYPGVTNTTTVSATDSCTAVNGVTSSHHQTTLFVDGTPIGSATARSQSNQGTVSDSKTLTWQMPAGGYPDQRLGVTVTADLGATQVVYTYEYVWQSTDVGQLVNPPEPTATTALSRQITVTGYDGSDTIHTPLTYLIRATQNGEALADETIFFQFFGDLDCLSGQYGLWNSDTGKWRSRTADFSVKESVPVQTDSRGYVAIRGFLDFKGMKNSGKQLPCAETLRAAVPRNKNDPGDLITADATVNVQYPVFVTGVFFRAAKDPQFSSSPWIPLGMIANQYKDFVTDRYEGDPAKAAYPGWTALLERVSVEGKQFNPPALDRTYYFPVNAGGDLNIRMCNDPVNDHAFMAFEDGIAVTVLWMDGVKGVFTQVRKDNDEPCGLRVKFSPADYSDFETNNPENWMRFAIGQAGDWVVENGVGIVGTALAGPEAGWIAQSVVEVCNWTGDVEQAAAICHDHRTLVMRSAVSVSTAADGLKTLYNFEGSPAVVDDTGKEVVAAPGEAIDFRLTGPVSVPARRDPPPQAVALKALTTHEPGLTTGTFEEMGLVPSVAPGSAAIALGNPVTSPASASTPTGGGTTATMLLCAGAALLIFGGGLAILLLTLRRRAGQPLQPRPGTPGAGGTVAKAPGMPLVWLSIGVAVLGVLCLGTGMFSLLFSSSPSSPPLPPAAAAAVPTQAPLPALGIPATSQAPAPALPASTQPPQSSGVQGTVETFTDDFASPSTGWPQVNDATHMVGYSEGSMYGIALKTDNMDSGVLIPHGFQLPLHEADLYFRVRPVQGTGYFGVYFDYQDADNQGYVAVTDGTYAIGRSIKGQYTSLLGSTWLKDPHIQSENGEFQIQLHVGDTLQLMVNGYTLPTVNNTNRLLGDIAIFAHAHKDSTPDPEFNYQVLIDDVTLKAR